MGRLVSGTHVDHVRPHRGDWSLFMDSTNLQALCHSCHSRKTAREDRGFGHAPNTTQRGCDERGRPLDPEHHWHKGER